MGKDSHFRAVKGMNDILPDQIGRWHRLERAFVRAAELQGFREVRTPIVENTSLFVRSIGETTDVVSKEMYTFEHHKDSLTLRPEGTASAARAYIEHKVQAKEPVTRWYYLGPMFRAERAQRGRYRQFYQAGCEIFGDPGPACDAELVHMLFSLFQEVGIPDLEVHINSIGGPDARKKHREGLLGYLKPRARELSETSRERLEHNPLRILDSKDPGDQEIVSGAPSVLEVLTDEDRRHWSQLKACLDALGTPYTVNPTLVRGLDYYTRTVFEIRSTAGELGAQNTLVGGGRYDGMVESLGGRSTPAIGFAMGLERLLLAMTADPVADEALCIIAPLGDVATTDSLVLARDLRALGARVEVDGRGNSLRSMLRRADSMGAHLCVVMGDSEVERGVLQLKDLANHSQDEVPRAKATRIIADRLLGAGGAD